MKQKPPESDAGNGDATPSPGSDPGQAEQVERLYRERHGNMVKRGARELRSRHDAEDAVQDISIRMLTRTKQEKIRSDGRFTNRAVTNEVRARGKKSGFRARWIRKLTGRWTSHEYPSEEESALFAADLDKIHELVPELPRRRLEAFHLVRLDGLSYEEAAVRMGINPGTVRNHVKQAIDHCMNAIARDSEE